MIFVKNLKLIFILFKRSNFWMFLKGEDLKCVQIYLRKYIVIVYMS